MDQRHVVEADVKTRKSAQMGLFGHLFMFWASTVGRGASALQI